MRYVDHVLVLGDAVTNDGIAATLLGSGLAGRVATGDLDDDLPADSATVGLFVVHGSGRSKRREDAVRRIRRRGSPSPVVELNRAVALGMAYGPEAGLELADAIVETGALAGYHLLPSVRGELLERLGRVDEARAAFAEAAAMTANEHERAVLLARAAPRGSERT